MVPHGNITTAFDAHGTGCYVSLAQGSNVAGYFVLTSTTNSIAGQMISAGAGLIRAIWPLIPRSSGLYAGSLYMFWLYIPSQLQTMITRFENAILAMVGGSGAPTCGCPDW